MTFREFRVVAHRWMGLLASLVLAIAGLTGAVLVWPGRFPGRGLVSALHDSLALGGTGRWIVLVATGLAILLQLGGLYLWFQRRIVALRLAGSWQRLAFDLHHVVGVVGFVLMLTLAVTGIGRVVMRSADTGAGPRSAARSIMIRYHAGEEFHPAVKLLYALASTGFAVQGFTGVVMWWKAMGSQSVPRKRATTRPRSTS
jgi:uncharacterized iron-regulated membrane protein